MLTSGKMVLLDKLMKKLKSTGHRWGCLCCRIGSGADHWPVRGCTLALELYVPCQHGSAPHVALATRNAKHIQYQDNSGLRALMQRVIVYKSLS